jgi:chromosome segregation ATPase
MGVGGVKQEIEIMSDYERLQDAADREIARLEQQLEDCQAASGNMDSAMHADVLELRVREQAAEIEALRDEHEHLIGTMTDITAALKLREAAPDAQITGRKYIVEAATEKQAEIERLQDRLEEAGQENDTLAMYNGNQAEALEKAGEKLMAKAAENERLQAENAQQALELSMVSGVDVEAAVEDAERLRTALEDIMSACNIETTEAGELARIEFRAGDTDYVHHFNHEGHTTSALFRALAGVWDALAENEGESS